MQRIRIVLAAISFLLLGCSLDAAIFQPMEESSLVTDPNRPRRDYVNGEVMNTSSGYQVRGVFGEISEKNVTSNGWKVEAVFYE